MRGLGLLFAVLVIATPGSASAATFTVTGHGDGGTCASPSACPSIRAALEAAEANSEADDIVVPDGTHDLVLGQLTIADNITILGAGTRTTIVKAGAAERAVEVPVGAVVTLSRLTLAGGQVAAGDGRGGNLLNWGGTVTLNRVRVTGGKAADGGGGIANEDGAVTIQSSLIDGNESGSLGGGILIAGDADPGALTVRDSTVAGNVATDTGGGIASIGSFPMVTRLERVTVARNRASAGVGGLAFTGAGTFTLAGSILDDNVLMPAGAESNCSGIVYSSGGGNVIGTDECGVFAAGGDVRGADALLGPTLVNAGGHTDVLALPAQSPAVDRLGACGGVDQREAPRPQGAACDSGAFEYNPPPDTTLSTTFMQGGRFRTFSFSSSEIRSTFQCRLDGPAGQGAFVGCISPLRYVSLPGASYTFFVRAVDGLGEVDPSPAVRSFVVSPNPAAHRRVTVDKVRGKIRVKVPGGRFADLKALREIADGSIADARLGALRLSFEPKAGGKLQSGTFSGGLFRLKQHGGTMEFALIEKLANCKKGSGARAAAGNRTLRRLGGNAKGYFRTRGRHASATVRPNTLASARGTKWLTEDNCAGTLTKVVKGKVAVFDFVRKKKIRLTKGEQYLARPKRR